MSQPCSVLAVEVTHEQMGATPNILVKGGLRFRKNEFNRKFLYITSDE